MFARAPLRRQRGLSLIELMVGLAVALLVALAAAASAIFFTASQRQGMTTSVTTASALNALAVMKEDIAQTGLGFVSAVRYTCAQLNVSRDGRLLSRTPFAPLLVVNDGTFDSLDVLYGTQVTGGAAVPLSAPSDTSSADLASLVPVGVGDAVLFAPAHDMAPGTCTIRTVTGVEPATASTPLRLAFDSAGTHNSATFPSPASYLIKDTLTPLGALQWHRYRVDGSNLLLEWPLQERSGVVLRDVVAFRVQYGMAPATVAGARKTTVTEWNDAADVGVLAPEAIDRLRALRIGIVTRGAQPEKPAPDGTCTATDDDAKPKLFGTEVTLSGNWKCFRYRTAVEVVPLRNFTMGLQ